MGDGVMSDERVVELANRHAALHGRNASVSAMVYVLLGDANYAMRHGNPKLARDKAIKSLSHSIGAEHEDYKAAVRQ